MDNAYSIIIHGQHITHITEYILKQYEKVDKLLNKTGSNIILLNEYHQIISQIHFLLHQLIVV